MGVVDINKKFKPIDLSGIAIGIINALLGAGGGMLVVPVLKKKGLTQTQAHATSIAVILPLTIISAAVYYYRGNIVFDTNLWFLLYGAMGAVIGALLLKKIPQRVLRITFGCFIIWSAVRLMMK